jgi:hypothetical protein
MVIKSYGLFWQRDEVNWYPGAGTKKAFACSAATGQTCRVFGSLTSVTSAASTSSTATMGRTT